MYEGAPAPVTAYIATVSKGAVLALALVWLGVYPAPLVRVIRVMVAGFLS